MIRFFLYFFLLIHSPAFAGNYVNSVKWSGKDAGYNDCGFTGFICTMYTKNVTTNRNSISLGQTLKVYANGKVSAANGKKSLRRPATALSSRNSPRKSKKRRPCSI